MRNQAAYQIFEIGFADREWIKNSTLQNWGDESVVVHGQVFYPWKLAGFIARSETNQVLGLITYLISGSECEIITLNSFLLCQGVGSALVNRVLREAERAGCERVCVTTTNDNQKAIDFYQKRGFGLAAVHQGAVDCARKIKPSIPQLSAEGVPINDEWEFVLTIPRLK